MSSMDLTDFLSSQYSMVEISKNYECSSIHSIY